MIRIRTQVDLNSYELEGSVSVFHAIIFVSLIVFLFSIVDITRFQMLQLEAVSSLKLAGENALSQYDTLLAKEYGLYAGAKGPNVTSQIQDTLQQVFFSNDDSKNRFFMDYLLNKSDFQSESSDLINANLQSKFMKPTSIDATISYTPFITPDFNNPKEQIITYMKEREPYLLIRPFLENIDFLSKTSRTSEVIDEKNDLLETLDCLDAYKKKLFLLIDGVNIDRSGTMRLSSDTSYIREIGFLSIEENPYDPTHHCVRSMDEQQRINNLIMTHIDHMESIYYEIEQVINGLITQETFEDIYVTVLDDSEPIFIGRRMNLFAKESLATLNTLQSELNEELEFFDQLEEIRQIHIEALSVVEAIEEQNTESAAAIDMFANNELSDDAILEGAKIQMKEELNKVMSALSSESLNVTDVNNMGLLKERIQKNLALFDATSEHVFELKEKIPGYICNRYYTRTLVQGVQNDESSQIQSALNTTSYCYHNDSIDIESQLEHLDYLSGIFKEYRTDLFLDYRQYSVSEKNSELKEAFESEHTKLKSIDIGDFFSSKQMIAQFPESNVDIASLPSSLLSATSIMTTGRSVDPMTSFTRISETLKENLESTHNMLLINEYAVGLFNNISRNNALNEKNMNGYDLESHFMSYEVEYILNGSLEERSNATAVLAYLYTLRLSCNLIHLAMDPEKRELIFNLANTLAGWWTGGVGAVLIGIIIAALWAMIESVIDIFMLTSGQRVPFIKTDLTWYSSLTGNWEEAFNTGVNRIQNEVTKESEDIKSTIDQFTTNLIQKINKQASSSGWSIFGTSEVDQNEKMQYLTYQLTDASDMLLTQTECQVEAYENLWRGYLYDLIYCEINSYRRNSTTERQTFENLQNPFSSLTEEYQLAENMREAVKKQGPVYFSEGWSLESSVALNDFIEFEFGAVIDTYVDNYKEAMTVQLNEMMEETFNAIQEKVSVCIDEGVEMTKKSISEIADQAKDEFRSKQQANNTSLTSGEQEFNWIPTFSYEDYLRLFLMLPIVDESTKIARIMDLIQLNLQKSNDDYQLHLVDYFDGLELSSYIEVGTYFIPVLSNADNKRGWGKKLRTIEVSYVK